MTSLISFLRKVRFTHLQFSEDGHSSVYSFHLIFLWCEAALLLLSDDPSLELGQTFVTALANKGVGVSLAHKRQYVDLLLSVSVSLCTCFWNPASVL